MNQEAKDKFISSNIKELRAGEIALSATSLEARGVRDLESYTSDSGFVRMRSYLSVCDGIPQGSMLIGDVPLTVDIDDCWEFNKPARHWSWWTFFQFVVVPTGEDSPPDFLLFVGPITPVEKPYHVVLRCPVPGGWYGEPEKEVELDDGDGDSSNPEDLEAEDRSDKPDEIEKTDEEIWWDRIHGLISAHFEVGVLSEQVWTVSGEQFDSTFPDF